LPISYNIAPSQKVLTIRFNPETQARSLDALQWGLIPYWAKDPKIAYRTINVRAEAVDKAPSYRQAILELIIGLYREQKLTLVLVTHDRRRIRGR